MRTLNLVRLAKHEIRAALRVVPLFLVALLLVTLYWRSDSAAVGGLFQSSPVETPPVVPDTPTPTAEATITTAPTEGATALPTDPATTAPAPTETLPPAQTDEVTPTQPPAMTNTPTPSEQPATATPGPSATSAAAEASATPDENQRYAEEDSNLAFEWGMLFDSVALGLSYIWLCCGGLLFLAIPIVFIILWVASKRRQEQEE